MSRLSLLVVLALVATSCLYLPAASRIMTASGGSEQPWWCDANPPMGNLDCSIFSAQIDTVLRNVESYPTVADAVAAGATEVAAPTSGIGVTYRLAGVADQFRPGRPQLLLYTGNEPTDRLAGVAHLVSGSAGDPAPEGYAGASDAWREVNGTGSGTWLLPMWIVRGFENESDVFAPAHPCLAAGVTLTSTSDACFVASHPGDFDVLVTNDDGIGAAGIDALVEALRVVPGVSVTVVAPATNQSGSGDSTTPGGVSSAPSTTAGGYPGVAVDGTPADSVRHALAILGETPDLIISGINDGQNMGPVVPFSGTVGAARTAARLGVPALATSQGGIGTTPDFPAGVATTLEWVETFRLGLGDNMAVANLNTPSCVPGTSVRETRTTFTALGLFGRDYGAQDCASTSTALNDDIDAFNRGFAAITDVGLDEPVAFAGTIDLGIDNADRCEVVGNECLLPFPSNALTVADPTAATGRRVALPVAALPTNSSGTPIDTARHNRNDGFSPGSAALVLLPGVNPTQSGLPPVTDIGASMLDSSASVVVDATTGERWPHWAELDSNATDLGRQGLFIRPARNYRTGDRIVIGLRNLLDGAGNALAPTDAFRAYRDRLRTTDPAIEARRPDMERLFVDLSKAGVAREDLVMAWDFTVISDSNLTGPMVAMRDDALAALGSAAPTFTIDSAVDDIAGGRRVINGTFEIPLYLSGDGSAGNGLNLLGGDDLPTRNGTWTAPFRCQVPFFDTPVTAGPGVVYGHGLLGSGRQATSSGPTALSRYNFVVCGTDLIGMAEGDIVNAVNSLRDASNFSTLADRLLQGHLNEIFLARLLAHPDGFAADPAFLVDGQRTIDPGRTYFYGISQGGIMGPVTTTMSPDIDRAVFGVPGVNYSTLLNRSIDFDTYQTILDPAYPDKLDQAIVLLADQMLWDRGEGNGYISYFADPLPGMNEKTALLHLALGDHQVANVAADVMARSMGASVVWPAVAPGRSTDVEPFWGIDRITGYPFTGSATVMWDSGSPLPPITNTPNHTGADPHSDPRVEPAAVEQLANFLLTGEVIDTCAGLPCLAAPT
jgi:broad specificity polyphosphatase/5'/3'-nucleotidase SurE